MTTMIFHLSQTVNASGRARYVSHRLRAWSTTSVYTPVRLWYWLSRYSLILNPCPLFELCSVGVGFYWTAHLSKKCRQEECVSRQGLGNMIFVVGVCLAWKKGFRPEARTKSDTSTHQQAYSMRRGGREGGQRLINFAIGQFDWVRHLISSQPRHIASHQSHHIKATPP